MFSNFPEDKLSNTVTLAPFSRSVLQRCEPIKPAPPVTTNFSPLSAFKTIPHLITSI